MFELTINGQVYGFNFGMGFLREINKSIVTPVDGLKGVSKEIGLKDHVAGLIDGEVEDLITILDIANKGNNPRVTRALLDSYVESDSTDIDALFDEVMDFLKSANATKNTVLNLLKEAEKAKEK